MVRPSQVLDCSRLLPKVQGSSYSRQKITESSGLKSPKRLKKMVSLTLFTDMDGWGGSGECFHDLFVYRTKTVAVSYEETVCWGKTWQSVPPSNTVSSILQLLCQRPNSKSGGNNWGKECWFCFHVHILEQTLSASQSSHLKLAQLLLQKTLRIETVLPSVSQVMQSPSKWMT